jgi:hypothetical protein
MRASSVEPFTPDPSTVLHPGLQAALDNLDLQLDDELDRYRRRQPESKKRAPKRLTASPRPDAAPFPEPARLPELPAAAPFYTGTVYTDPVAADPWADVAPPPPPSQMAHFDARQMVRDRSHVTSNLAVPVAEDALTESYLPENYALENHESDITDGYLASSEELLRSLAQPTPSIKRQTTLLDSLLTPLGVGSMLLLLLSSVSLGYLLMNPATLLAAFGRGGTVATPAGSSPTATGETSTLSPDLASGEFMDVNLNTLSQLPRGANRQPTTIVTLPPTASPSPIANPTASIVTSPIQNPLQTVIIPSQPTTASQPATQPATRSAPAAPAAPAPSAPTRQASAPARPAPAPAAPARSAAAPARPAAPAAAAPAAPTAPTAPTAIVTVPPAPTIMSAPPSTTISQAPPSSGDRYYVVTDYTGDPSLNQARQAVSDAYVRNFNDGAKVQMGSFTDAASAEQLAQDLQQQGVPAKVYHP